MNTQSVESKVKIVRTNLKKKEKVENWSFKGNKGLPM